MQLLPPAVGTDEATAANMSRLSDVPRKSGMAHEYYSSNSVNVNMLDLKENKKITVR